MEISSLSHTQTVAHVQKTHAKQPLEKWQRSDEVLQSEGMQEAQKMREWVQMLKDMPDTSPTHFERGGESSDVLFEIACRLGEEVGGFLTKSP